MSSLYRIEQELIELRNLLETENEFADESPEKEFIEQNLEIKQEQLATKTEGYLYVISGVEAQVWQAEKEIERIQKFIQRKKNIVNRLNAALLQAVLLFGEENKNGIKSLEFGSHRLATRRSQSVVITNVESVPDDCKLHDVTFKNLSTDIQKFLHKRISELPDSSAKKELLEKFNAGTKIVKKEVKKKIEGDVDIEWAKLETKYNLQ